MVFDPTMISGSVFPPMPRFNASVSISVTPTITSGSAYAAGYQLGGIMALPNAVRQGGQMSYGFSELVNVTILDKSKQDSAIDVWFFNQSPTVVSSDHAAFNISSGSLGTCLGVVQLGASGLYSDASAVSVCSNSNLNLPLSVPNSVTNPSNIYAVAVCRGTPTYTSTTALTFIFSLFMD